jgi:hypothetical protein
MFDLFLMTLNVSTVLSGRRCSWDVKAEVLGRGAVEKTRAQMRLHEVRGSGSEDKSTRVGCNVVCGCSCGTHRVFVGSSCTTCPDDMLVGSCVAVLAAAARINFGAEERAVASCLQLPSSHRSSSRLPPLSFSHSPRSSHFRQQVNLHRRIFQSSFRPIDTHVRKKHIGLAYSEPPP